MRRPARVEDTDDLRRRMLTYKKDCGCTAGAVVMTVTLLASLTWTLADHRLGWLQVLVRLPLIGLLGLLAAGVGKLLGLLYARHRYHTLSERLTRAPSLLTGQSTSHGGNVD